MEELGGISGGDGPYVVVGGPNGGVCDRTLSGGVELLCCCFFWNLGGNSLPPVGKF